jgi:hypothetical protein
MAVKIDFMNKKLLLITIIVIGFVAAAIAYTTLDFPGWPLLTQNSSDIIIARCTETPTFYPANKNEIEHDLRGLIDSKITIVSILKGTGNSKTSELISKYQPVQNGFYLIFARSNNGAYQAFEEYRVISLGERFSTNSIAGKPLDEQIQVLFQQSVNHLNQEIQKDQEEKQRIEGGIVK